MQNSALNRMKLAQSQKSAFSRSFFSMQKIKEKELRAEIEELYALKRELLYHVVGMSYNMQKVQEIDTKIKGLELILKGGGIKDDDRG